MNIPFSKYHGAGNDFIIIDNRSDFILLNPSQVAAICNRRLGVGADGVILLERSSLADYRMRIFNADGSEPTMCGNGLRCLVDFIGKLGYVSETILVEVAGRLFTCQIGRGKISVNLGPPRIDHWPLVVETSHGALTVFVLDTGVPHAVIWVDEISEVPLAHLGRELRFHPFFSPHGVNVNVVESKGEQVIALRTYERGVEGETLACGTGAAAAAFVAAQLKGGEAWSVMTKNSLEENVFHPTLSFRFPFFNDTERAIEMVGEARCVFTGHLVTLYN